MRADQKLPEVPAVLNTLPRFILAAGLSVALAALSAQAAPKVPVPPAKVDASLSAAAGQQTAVFAGGCFWGVQAVFERVKGVVKTTAGYAGGSASTARYQQVITETTGHAESVEVVFDPSRITYGQLLRVFFSAVHDPTELNRQGPDVGTSYRSAIFYTTEDQKRIAAAFIAIAGRRESFPGQDRHRSDAAQRFLSRRGLPPGFRAEEPDASLHPDLRPAEDRSAQATIPRAFRGLQGRALKRRSPRSFVEASI